jgi:lysophospholipase L1-like esterase
VLFRSVIRNGESEFWIKATAPQDARYVLQASANLHLWVDINDEVSGQSSNRFDNAGVTERYFRLIPWTPPPPPIILMLIGDSTVADLISNDNMFNGWGQGIHGYFKPDVRVVNLAYPCYSTTGFLASAEMQKMLLIKPDFVLVQFGMIDELGCSGDMSARYATTLKQYADNLQTIVQTIRGFNGTPVLITPPVPQRFDDQGRVIPLYQDRMAVVRSVAAELHTHLIDLNQLTTDLFNGLGRSESQYIWWSAEDRYHFSALGAQVIARLVVNALPDSLGPYLTGILDQPPMP